MPGSAMGGTRCAQVMLVAARRTVSVRAAAARHTCDIRVCGSALVPTGAPMVERHSTDTTKSGVDLGPGQYSPRPLPPT